MTFEGMKRPYPTPRPHKKLFAANPEGECNSPLQSYYYTNGRGASWSVSLSNCVRPKCPIDISTKLRCTQIIPILLPSTQKLEEPSISPMIKLTGSDSDNFMKITVDIPDEIAQRLGQTGDNLAHKLLEMVIADAYRAGILSTAEVGRILQLPSRLETHAFLKRMAVYLNYDEIELERDLQTLKELRAK